MNSKTIISIVVALVVIGGGFFLLSRTSEAPTDAVPPASSSDVVSPGAAQTESTAAPNTQGADVQTTNSAPSGADQPTVNAPTPQTVVVTYSSAGGFSPAQIAVTKGDTVRFVNESGGDMWVASAPHPAHTAYDGTSLSAHCFGSGASVSFDQCGAGNEYSFTFDTAGTWKYHDHVHPSKFGSVVVE